MNDDIVTRLRQKYAGQLPICTEAADEIERLRAMCDMLANRLRSGSDSGWDDAIDAWEDVSEFGNDPESQGSAKLSPNSETNIDDTIQSDSINILLERLSSVSRSMWISDMDGHAVLKAISLIVEQDKKIRTILELFDEHYTCEYCDDRSSTYLATCQNPLHALHEIYMSLSGV